MTLAFICVLVPEPGSLILNTLKKASANKSVMGMRYNRPAALRVYLSKKQTVVAFSVSTMWSKVFGFLREMLTAFYFGAGAVKDAFNVSQAIPTRIGSAFFGAINSSLVPCHIRSTLSLLAYGIDTSRTT